MLQARGILARIGAGCVVGFGGYPCVAPVLAARLLRRRPAVILHEQNAVLGRANRFLAHRADVLALGFESTERVPVGNTDRGDRQSGATSDRRAVADQLRRRDRPHQAAGSRRITRCAGVFRHRAGGAAVVAGRICGPGCQWCSRFGWRTWNGSRPLTRPTAWRRSLSPFFPDVAARLVAAHLVIARAGASTVAELAVAGRPAILVPLPGAIDDHQSANARALARPAARGWCRSRALPRNSWPSGWRH